MADAIWVLTTDKKGRKWYVNPIAVGQTFAAWERGAILANADVETTTARKGFLGGRWVMESLNYDWKQLRSPGCRTQGISSYFNELMAKDGSSAQANLVGLRVQTQKYLSIWQGKLEHMHKVNVQFFRELAQNETNLALAKAVRDGATAGLIICATGGMASGALSAAAGAGVGWSTVAAKGAFEYSESGNLGKTAAVLTVEGASFVLGGCFAELAGEAKAAKAVGFLCLQTPFELCRSAISGDNLGQTMVGVASGGVGFAAEMFGIIGKSLVAAGATKILTPTKELVKDLAAAVGIDLTKSALKQFFKDPVASGKATDNVWKAFFEPAAINSDQEYVAQYCVRPA